MITYIIKIVLCSALFLFIYKLLLEKEKMYRFNRFYLLFSLVFSFVVPFITFNQHVPYFPVAESINTSIVLAPTETSSIVASENNTNYIYVIALLLYAIISLLFLFRFIKNLFFLLKRAESNPKILYNNSEIVLLEQPTTPHSFLNYIFISTEDYDNGNIEKEILIHELTHVHQKHSLDIIFIEILLILFWFNPFIWFYRKALLLNHEFLADEAVTNDFTDVAAYQTLLLKKAGRQTNSVITNQLNYSITKKRFIMMTKSSSLAMLVCKQIAVIPVIAIALFVFSTKISAQDTSKFATPKIEVPSTKEGVSQEEFLEYETIVNKTKNAKGFPVFSKFTEADKYRLETLFLKMSKEQQEKQVVVFLPSAGPLPKVTPTVQQFDSWKNAKIYGIWINSKRVNNSQLNKYKNTDFSQVFVSKLGKNTVNYGKHYYQVDLMTNDYYNDYLTQTIANRKKYHLAIRIGKKVGRVAQNGKLL